MNDCVLNYNTEHELITFCGGGGTNWAFKHFQHVAAMSRGSNLEDFDCLCFPFSLFPPCRTRTQIFVIGLQPVILAWAGTFSSTFHLTPCPQLTSLAGNVISDAPLCTSVENVSVLELDFPCFKLFMNRTGWS